MRVFRGFNHSGIAPGCALTIGNFDGVHRGHQAMLALLRNEARHRSLPSCVLTFEPHPRDHFARRSARDDGAPARISTLRDKLGELARCGIDQAIVVPFNDRFCAPTPQAFIDDVLVRGLHARYVLVGDDFCFGAKRAGDYAMLDAAGQAQPEGNRFDVARMLSYEVHGLRVSSSAVRDALAAGDMASAAALLGRPYSISGHVVHGRKLGRELGFRTLNVRFRPQRAATQGICVVNVHGLTQEPLAGVANFGVRPSLSPTDKSQGQILLETHCLSWPTSLGLEGAYGRVVQIELLHKLHDELKYESLAALESGIAKDCADALQWHAQHGQSSAA